MKIAIAQLNYIIGDFDGNADKIIKAIKNAQNDGADLVVFSELAVTGYYPHDLLEKKEFIDRAEETVEKIARHCIGIAAVVGAPKENDNERGKSLFNAAYFLADGEINSVHKKTLLPTYDIFDEYRHFEPNYEFSVVKFKNERLAITVCEDLWDEQPVANEFGRNKLYRVSPMEQFSRLNPSLIINISASPFSFNQENWRKEVISSKAKKYGLPIIYVNQTGAQTELIFDGGSAFFNNKGDIVKELKYFEEDFLIIDTQFQGDIAIQPVTEVIQRIHNALVLGIKDYFEKLNFKKAVIGLSGGIDSAVTLVLAVKAWDLRM